MTDGTHRVIFDTDIGTDVDDIIALAFLLGSPEISIEGVTTVYADVELRARMVQKFLQLRGVSGVPVHIGVSKPIVDSNPPFWLGHEGVGLLSDDDELPPNGGTHAVEFLIDHVLANPEEITLLAVGPLTNVATAVVREPRFAKLLKRLVIMGGCIATHESDWGVSEHNIRCDPEAAQVVFASGAPIELVPLDITLRATIDQPGVNAIRARQSPYHEALADQIELYPAFIERGKRTYLHDPLAAMAVLRPDLLTWKPYHLEVELTGRVTRAMTVATKPGASRIATARAAMDLDVPACQSLILERISS
jgi:purine nucleosidase